MSTLHLIRHGQASAGTDNYDRLSTIGQQQSRILGQWWLSHGFSPKAAFHGTLVRQRDTAELALESLLDNGRIPPMQAHDGLNEYDHRVVESYFASGHADYAPESMSFDDYMAIISRWRDHAQDATSDADIESWTGFKARGWQTLKELTHQHDDKELVFFTSGGVIATVLATVLNLDFEHTIDAIWRIRNTSITSFQLTESGKARLIEFNAIPHLLEQRKPHLITLI